MLQSSGLHTIICDLYGPSGGWIDVDLSTWAGMNLQIAFRYRRIGGTPGDDRQCRVDDVTVGDETPVDDSTRGAVKALHLH
ncbi:MAG: hypothetical protein GF405_11095 [Candidatus Eisenbacteria bacterium]|nr:hypothetical protein [Candidatus Eisenbacteria bacterium]